MTQKKQHQAALIRTSSPVAARDSGVMATVTRDGNMMSIHGDLSHLRHAERTMPVDCARALMRRGSPEIQFGQLDPFNEKRLTRVLVVRYDRDRFCERTKLNETFREGLEKHLKETGKRGTPGDFTTGFESPQQDHACAIVDAEAEVLAHAGGRAAMICLTISALDMTAAMNQKRDTVELMPDLEFTMPAWGLADLLTSWKELAEKL